MFEVDSATGQIKVAEAPSLNGGNGQPALDYESGNVEFTVQGQLAVGKITINITDVTGPATPAAPSVAWHSGSPRSALRVSWTAPNDYNSPITDYDVQYRRGTSGSWSSHGFSGTGTITTISGLSS